MIKKSRLDTNLQNGKSTKTISSWWCHQMKTFLRVTGPCWMESTGHRWIPLTKARDAELWWFLWYAPEQTVKQTIETMIASVGICNTGIDNLITIMLLIPNNKASMMASLNGNIFRVTGHLCGEFTGDLWIPRTTAGDAELWFFLWSAPEWTFE